ncbi:MAG: prepilin-type N-terminal cleavage/methylation domain-containing protein [Candidatus Wallbacteria bacterium]|nr:prepilin-type N-terminal cleavage/methylation domain-containing protein [Candidatus Wallbacteria bacterium]
MNEAKAFLNRLRSSSGFSKRGFSFIEVMATLVLIGIILAPLFRMMLIGKKGVLQGKEFLIVANLSREKIEELNVIPLSHVKNDFDNFKDIYKDCMITEFKDADKIPARFYEVFSDIWTDEDRLKYESIYEKFQAHYLEVYGQDYLTYPEEFGRYRRLVMVDEEYSENKRLMKKASVHIYAREKGDKPVFTLMDYVIE